MDARVVADVLEDAPLAQTQFAKIVLDSISEKACDKAAEYGSNAFNTFSGGRLAFFPQPDYENGYAGVGINPEHHYLVYLEEGFASFPMTSLYGKTIPMVIGGNLVFRKVTNINQWRSGHKTYYYRDADGEIMADTRQARSWVHPGHEPVRFIERALDDVIDDYQEEIDYAYFAGWMDWD